MNIVISIFPDESSQEMLEKFQNSTDYTKKDIRYLLVLFQ